MYGGPIFWDLTDAGKVMRFWRDYILDAPERLNAYFGFHTIPPSPLFPEEHHLKKIGDIVCCYPGDFIEAERAIRPFREVAPPIIDYAGPIPFPALQGLFDGLYPPGLQWYWNADFFTKVSDQVIDLHLEHFAQAPTIFSGMHLYPINGAVHRAGRSDTAWSYRDANFAQVKTIQRSNAGL